MAEFKIKDIEIKELKPTPENDVYKYTDRGTFPIHAKAILLNGVRIITGKGSPLNVVVAPVGSLYLRQDGGANTTLYIKESLTTAGGWVAK